MKQSIVSKAVVFMVHKVKQYIFFNTIVSAVGQLFLAKICSCTLLLVKEVTFLHRFP